MSLNKAVIIMWVQFKSSYPEFLNSKIGRLSVKNIFKYVIYCTVFINIRRFVLLINYR